MDAISCLPPAALLLQVQTSDSSSMHSASSPTISSSHYSPLLMTTPSSSSSCYAPHQHAIPGASARRGRQLQLAPSAAGKGKRRSRASKRAPTTFITTDPTNFRLMVQHVTGAHQLPAPIDDTMLQAAIMLRTSPSTADDADGAGSGCYYSYGAAGGGIFVGNPPLLPLPGGATTTTAGDDLQALHQQQQQLCFPTLDSWNVTTMYDRTDDLV